VVIVGDKSVFKYNNSFSELQVQLYNKYVLPRANANIMEQSPSWEADCGSASKEVPCFYGIWRFITVLTRAHHQSVSWTVWIHLTPSHPISLRSILILSFNFCLGLPHHLICKHPMYYMCMYLLRFSFNTLILGYKIHQQRVSVTSTVIRPFWCLPT
jgi:hypothetical protein